MPCRPLVLPLSTSRNPKMTHAPEMRSHNNCMHKMTLNNKSPPIPANFVLMLRSCCRICLFTFVLPNFLCNVKRSDNCERYVGHHDMSPTLLYSLLSLFSLHGRAAQKGEREKTSPVELNKPCAHDPAETQIRERRRREEERKRKRERIFRIFERGNENWCSCA